MKRLAFLILLTVQVGSAQQSPHGPLRFACSVCHTTTSWAMRQDSAFDHSVTGFALLGQHKHVACASCHEKLIFTRRSTACTTCHTDIHRSELGANCLRCHTMDSWIIADMRQKHQQTRFPLLGKHALADCDACHARTSPQRYAGTPLTCVSCHRSDFEGTVSPNHVQVGFSVDCSQCHLVTDVSWGGQFNHDVTGFPLTGAHRAVLCSQCHLNNRFTKLPTDCYSCHQNDFNTVQQPNHLSGGFSHSCQTCHTTIAWSPATFDHNSTKFPLTGKHQTLLCQACHVGGNYSLTYVDCYQCHSTDYQQVTDPNHVTGQFSHNCLTCHTTSGWSPSTFNHSATNFPLTGAHTTLQCQACHTNGNYQLTYTICYQCHQSDYQQTTNPNHVAGNYSHDCSTCHSTTDWGNASFNHSTTSFPLTGAHVAVQCLTCHVSGNYQLTYTDCYQCHSTDYQQTTNPNHVSGNYSHNCLTCHSTVDWSGASFDHSTTKFPLVGAHTTVLCATCHVSGNYQLSYTDCYMCHQSDYQIPTNPNHVTLLFDHNCLLCHTQTAWTPSTFNHDVQYFKIYSGAHQGKWTLCSDCHTVAGNYASFTCITCHTQSTTDGQHLQVSGYSYSSPACYSCHRGV